MDAEQPFDSETLVKALTGETAFNKLLEFSEEDIQVLAALGFDLYQQGRTDDARVVFEGLVALDDGVFYGHAGLGAIALEREELDAAIAHLRRATELKPNEVTLHANLGEALLRQGQFEEAGVELQKAMELDPEGKDPGADRARAILGGIDVIIEELEKGEVLGVSEPQ